MLFLKAGVRIAGMRPEILLAAVAAERCTKKRGTTSRSRPAWTATHMAGSLHYAGAAIDVRTRDIALADVQKLIARIKTCLGDDFDVMLEVDHVHIEFQQKQALGV